MVFIPLSDDNPLRSIHFQWVTVGLIAANVLVFLWQSMSVGQSAAASFAIIPAELFKVSVFGGPAHGPYDSVAVPEGVTLLTYMFLHGDILHLLSNMIFLWVFGDNIEDAMGHLRYLVFYVLAGVLAGLAHGVVNAGDLTPAVGASGAIAGVMGAYIVLFPRATVRVIIGLIFIPIPIPAFLLIGFWFVFQVFSGFSALGVDAVNAGGGVAYFAHIGGFVAGAVLVHLFVIGRRAHIRPMTRPERQR